MAPSQRASGATIDYSKVTNVKELLDRIGETVRKKVHDAALERKGNLQAQLSQATFEGTQIHVTDPCDLDYNVHTNVTTTVINPCDRRSDIRFSDESRSQCTKNRIKDSVNDDVGACAPYRRLHVCDRNLEQIQPHQITTTHNLLVDVCMAAKFEGESIAGDHPRYKLTNNDSQICTALARSFADIGDIIRGKDLYLGNKKEKENLEKNLKNIFEKIYDHLTPEAKKHYKKDEDPNYYKLREDWWDLNRLQVWKAITCGAPKDSAHYFRKSCSNKLTDTNEKCTCANGDPPTYFDYVPQYLRWFEEWTEEFCRKKKKYSKIMRKYCRGEKDEKYCSVDGYDCEETVSKIGKLRFGNACTKCLVACSHYKRWLANEEKEFKKQKEKYKIEISRFNDSPKISNKGFNDIYEKDFYKKLRDKYSSVEEFLKLLNEENECKIISKEGGKIDFIQNDEKGTFYPSEYCEPCPECGVTCEGGKCRNKPPTDKECAILCTYDPPTNIDRTNINVLYSGKEGHDILKKLDQFCQANDNSYNEDEKWECYYESADNNKCRMEIDKKKTKITPSAHKHPHIMMYDDFFTFWVNDMLRDSIDWREEMKNCINSAKSNKCKSGCKRGCDCFEKWVKKKQEEWNDIKKQYEKQGDLPRKHHFAFLEKFLEFQFLPTIEMAYGNEKAIKKIEELLDKKSNQEDAQIVDKRDIIDELLDHEKDDAQECKNNNERETCPEQSHDDDDYDDILHMEGRNPCGRGRPNKNVKEIARQMQLEAKETMVKNSVDDGGSVKNSVPLDGNGKNSALRADISKATFRKSESGKDLARNICIIDMNKHTNDSRYDNSYKGPCTGKDNSNERFRIGTPWQGEDSVSKTHKNVYIPPRRQHMCTSNLEKLKVDSVIGYNNVNASFLGDVLLAANKQAERIKNDFSGKKDNSTACRAVRNSFADLGDIIRGRDLWDEDSGAKEMEHHLKKIFEKIKEELPRKIKEKYKDDENKKIQYKQLREDWWEANRRQVWNAMKCPTTKGTFPCDKESTPIDDYIPQRLRWMTEWAEWYCKYQSQEYNQLVASCESCRNEGANCTKNSGDVCTKCSKACIEYNKRIKTWNDQWTKMQLEYTLLYLNAQATSNKGGITAYSNAAQEKDIPVVYFLQKLQKANGDTTTSSTVKTPYNSAAGYIHQEASSHMQCNTLTEFCKNGNGNKHAFEKPPPDYVESCKCESRDNTPVPPPVVPQVNVCATVATALTQENLTQACQQKYEYGREKFPNWKCIPTGGGDNTRDSDASGSICVPPRRRRLYVGGLTKWASGNTQESKVPQDSTPATASQPPNGDPLLTAFVESAAVETFFLWHKYKVENTKKPDTIAGALGIYNGYSGGVYNGVSLFGTEASGMKAVEGGGAPGAIPRGLPSDVTSMPLGRPGELGVGVGVPGAGIPSEPTALPSLNLGGDDSDPEKLLQTGHIPPDFLRLMFYTLGDYRDILVGNTPNGIDTNGKETDMQKIKTAIESVLKPSGSSSPAPGEKNPVQTPQEWWKANGEHIWNGMICALTYEDSEGKEQPPKQNEKVKNALWDEKNKKPKTKTNNGPDYTYENVVLKEDDSGEMKTNDAINSQPPTLSQFISRSPYFRYLEEWGQNFCKERKKRLEEIYKDCQVDENNGPRGAKQNPKCSCYGEDCDDQLEQKPTIFRSLLCQDCGKHCRYYKKWIKTKKTEYEKQQNLYDKQKTKCQTQSKGAGGDQDNKPFCGSLETTYPTAATFLRTLGSCKKDNNENESGQGSRGDNKKIFDDIDKTFGPADNCNPCSKFKIDCRNGNCGGGNTKGKCNGKNTINASDIENGDNSTVLDMRVSDNSNSGNGFNGLEACITSGIFQGIKENKYKCANVCGYVVCKSEKGNGETASGENNDQIITIRGLVEHWVHNFLEDYNRIRKKLKACIENGNGSICTSDCGKKCKCVKEWIGKKRTEWEEIIQRLNDQYKDKDLNDYNVKSVLETLQPQTEVLKAIKPCNDLNKFQDSKECAVDANSENGVTNKKDIVECLLDKLETKAKKCEQKHQTSGNPQQPCEESSAEPDDEPFEEEENPVGKQQPSFCPKVDTTEEEKTDDKCGEIEEKKDEKKEQPEQPAGEGEDNEGSTPLSPPSEKKTPAPEKKVPRPAPRPRRKKTPKIVDDHPAVIPSLATSTLMWTVGIGFATFTYFFLKKKTKASVGNLFQILQIPKGDYDIPTLKSSNRYIPYASDRYKGKTYIYMEGDSSGDEKYAFISDTTDVTSSESEYEELDINDIYVPGSPKYKTLIEVVLEPSKRDIQSDDTPMNNFTDEEWNQLKHDFISNMLQSQPNDVPNDYKSGDIPFNTQPNTLYFDKPQEKPFITSIHDRNLYSGEEYNYNVNMVNNDIPISGTKDTYSGIDLINDSLNNNKVDIYDEVLKRKENELFGTNHPKHTNTHSVNKSSNSDPIDNQLDLFHTWLDRHRDMCEQWNNKEEVLDKLKEEWNKDKNSGDIPSDSNKTLNTDVSIQIHMDNPKPINQFTNMDTILDDLKTYNEPYYDVQDDIYYDVNDHDASTVDSNAMDVPSKVKIEMDVNTKLVKEKYPIADVWDI